MAFQTVPNVAEAVVRYTVNGQLCTLTFYGRFLGGYDQSDIDGLATGMDDWADTELKTVLTSSTTYNSIEVRGLTLQNDLFASNSTNSGVGDVAQTPAPNMVAFAVKRVTGFTGRTARGRVYMPIALSFLDGNEDFITSAAADTITAVLNEVKVYMAVEGWQEVVVSRWLNGSLRAEGLPRVVVNYEYADLEVDSQRRRMPGR